MTEIVVTGGLNDEEETLLLQLLRKVRQPYSARFFEALAQVLPVLGIEVVVLRQDDQSTKVLLTRRPEASPSWPGQWQSPGTIFRVTDESFMDMIRRLEETEFGAELWNLRLAYFTVPPQDGTRARNAQLVHVADISPADKHNGTWFDIKSLPQGIIPGQADMVVKAAHLLNEGLLLPAVL
jgi:8-oxo-dGTP pyrophosphatase MutT (NUDIX family)